MPGGSGCLNQDPGSVIANKLLNVSGEHLQSGEFILEFILVYLPHRMVVKIA